jgi:hypothetical protein
LTKLTDDGGAGSYPLFSLIRCPFYDYYDWRENMMNLSKIKLLLVLLSWLFYFNLVVTQAADLTFTPEAPLVQKGGQITLSVSGTSGDVTWSSLIGQIQGSGSQVTYLAPMVVGVDVVTVLDNSTGQVGTVKVTVSLAFRWESVYHAQTTQ